MNAILAACGFNLRKLLRAFFWLIFKELERLKMLVRSFKTSVLQQIVTV
jgi:outer membrane lipopolysaccharide assembly protein LptE/RlpB